MVDYSYPYHWVKVLESFEGPSPLQSPQLVEPACSLAEKYDFLLHYLQVRHNTL